VQRGRKSLIAKGGGSGGISCDRGNQCEHTGGRSGVAVLVLLLAHRFHVGLARGILLRVKGIGRRGLIRVTRCGGVVWASTLSMAWAARWPQKKEGMQTVILMESFLGQYPSLPHLSCTTDSRGSLLPCSTHSYTSSYRRPSDSSPSRGR